MEIKKVKRHTLKKVLSLPDSAVKESQLKYFRSALFEKGLDVVQLHRSTGLCVVTDEEWEECKAWHTRLCNKDWTAFEEIPEVVKKHLPTGLKRLVNAEV